ncbi:hypothetical protein [Tautonia plasticadhaerens]|uniref:Uncharacterized protein n=1 Tax=Tautonia plasticadhaerens TaxID=2527974 RepID=A0A518GZM3_9BACT|nr:hypothetical protein [Tautonia plasticadhaerens]QDV34032.1 hypothetical protein ElP_19130 [Tautonia plasticadhaerens]
MHRRILAAFAALFAAASLGHQPGALSRSDRRRLGVGRADPDRFGSPRVAPSGRAIRRRLARTA